MIRIDLGIGPGKFLAGVATLGMQNGRVLLREDRQSDAVSSQWGLAIFGPACSFLG